MLGLFKKRSLYKDIFWQIGGSVINRASFFLALLLLSGFMLKSEYGGFSLAYNYALSISSVVSTGLGITARRELVKDSTRKDQFTILVTNCFIIFIICFFICLAVTLYFLNKGTIDLYPLLLFIILLLLSFNASLSYYLNYHYAGLGLFKAYNLILLPVNVLLPVLLVLLKPQYIVPAGIIIAIILLIGNAVQVLYLKDTFSFGFSFHKDNLHFYIPCFLQALLGLPVLAVLQTIIVSRWHDIAFIGLIVLMQQILNISNIFASKSLTVFSPRITKQMNSDGIVRTRDVLMMFFAYLTIIVFVTGIVYIFLPFILHIVNSNYQDSISDMRYFLLMNIIISSTWFIPEYYHAIRKSWVSFTLNAVFSVSIFIVFYSLYSTRTAFGLKDYANCLTLSRIVFLVPILYSLCIRLKGFFSKSVCH